MMRAWLLAAVACALTAPADAADVYPSRPVRMIVAVPPGGPADILARLVGPKLTEALGQTVVIDNRGGAGGGVGSEAVARSAPDGYTLLMGTIGTHSINPAVYAKINYDPIKDFEPVIQFGTAQNVLVVHPDLPIKSVADLIAYIKANPGKVNYGSSGNGTSNHLSGAMFVARNGLNATHIPYKGGAQAITDLLRGEIQFMFYHYLPLLGHIQDGKLRAIANTNATRIDALPGVPVMKEAGMDDFVVSAWFGVWAPAKTPKEVVTKLNETILKIISAPQVKKNLLAQGIDPVAGSPADLLKLNQAELARWAKAVEQAGAKLSN
jgi:tripartite-type tricarboxylate transporter receptor subunit TctC